MIEHIICCVLKTGVVLEIVALVKYEAMICAKLNTYFLLIKVLKWFMLALSFIKYKVSYSSHRNHRYSIERITIYSTFTWFPRV